MWLAWQALGTRMEESRSLLLHSATAWRGEGVETHPQPRPLPRLCQPPGSCGRKAPSRPAGRPRGESQRPEPEKSGCTEPKALSRAAAEARRAGGGACQVWEPCGSGAADRAGRQATLRSNWVWGWDYSSPSSGCRWNRGRGPAVPRPSQCGTSAQPGENGFRRFAEGARVC